MIAQRRKKMAVTHLPKISTLLLRVASPEPKAKVDQLDSAKKIFSKHVFYVFRQFIIKEYLSKIMPNMRAFATVSLFWFEHSLFTLIHVCLPTKMLHYMQMT